MARVFAKELDIRLDQAQFLEVWIRQQLNQGIFVYPQRRTDPDQLDCTHRGTYSFACLTSASRIL